MTTTVEDKRGQNEDARQDEDKRQATKDGEVAQGKLGCVVVSLCCAWKDKKTGGEQFGV